MNQPIGRGVGLARAKLDVQPDVLDESFHRRLTDGADDSEGEEPTAGSGPGFQLWPVSVLVVRQCSPLSVAGRVCART